MTQVLDSNDKRESIKQQLITRLNSITKANGYSIEPVHISDNMKHWEELSADSFPALLIVGGDEVYSYATNRSIDSSMMPVIVGYVKSEEQSDTQLNALIRAVRSAILGTNKTEAGLAFITYVDRVSTDKGSLRPIAAFEMSLRIIYRDTLIS